ncbi:MAG: hypothetical protein CVV59_00945, partial [Tenericutes bacterium HGW-Tenericutes-4]
KKPTSGHGPLGYTFALLTPLTLTIVLTFVTASIFLIAPAAALAIGLTVISNKWAKPESTANLQEQVRQTKQAINLIENIKSKRQHVEENMEKERREAEKRQKIKQIFDSLESKKSKINVARHSKKPIDKTPTYDNSKDNGIEL